ncbi:MAG: flagellar biosynthesis protein FlhF [Pseudomonadota bacterium]
MKIRTYFAKDMRQALRQVREEQGLNAVILSTRAVPGGVEVSAAVDSDSMVFEQLTAIAAATPAATPAADFAALLSAAAAIAVQPAQSVPPLPAAAQLEIQKPAADDAPQLGAELRSMRHLLETQMAQLAWNDLTRRSPAQAELLKDLTELGLAAQLATELVTTLPANLGYEEAHRHCLEAMSRRIKVTGDSLLDSGGRVAFVGPTGVGKTTAIAKIAARWVMRHGAHGIALVSLDSQRFGAQEQLKVLGRLLGVEAFALDDPASLPDLLARLPDRRLVLIDTAGSSPRDPELAERARQFTAVAETASIEICLTLSAGAQAGVLQEAVALFTAYRPGSCLITKLDEAASLGGTLSMLIASGLPVNYVSEGQRIPEDLSPARADKLVGRAVHLARAAGAEVGEDLLTRRFGGSAHGIA